MVSLRPASGKILAKRSVFVPFKIPTLLMVVVLSVAAGAQMVVAAKSLAGVNQLFDEGAGPDTLKCSIQKTALSLDFSLRYDEGYFITTKLGQLQPGQPVITYVRVKPHEGAPTVLGEAFMTPKVSAETTRRLGEKKVRDAEVRMSGAIALGEGRYSIEVMLVDKEHHTCRKHWDVDAPKPHDASVTLALKPDSVAPLISEPWDGKVAPPGQGLRVTVLLHASSMSRSSARLYAWDRAFLLEALKLLLTRLPCQSVKIIAFNLAQERELFRAEDFDGPGFQKLTDALSGVELATVSYKALSRDTWPDLLVKLTQEQVSGKEAPDAVVFLGRAMNFLDKVPESKLKDLGPIGPHLFYLEYFPWTFYEFPDSIDHMTHDLHGTVYRIHSAAEFADAVHKMAGQVPLPGKASGEDVVTFPPASN